MSKQEGRRGIEVRGTEAGRKEGNREKKEEDVPLSPSQAALKLLPYTALPAALVARVRRCCRL